MTFDPFLVDVGLVPVLQAVTLAARGASPDLGALRVRLLGLQDQHDVMARSAGHDEAWVGSIGAQSTRDLVSVVDRLEVGDVRRATRRLAAVLRLRFEMAMPLDWRRL